MILDKDGEFSNFLRATLAKKGFAQRHNEHNGVAFKVFVVIVVPLCETLASYYVKNIYCASCSLLTNPRFFVYNVKLGREYGFANNAKLVLCVLAGGGFPQRALRRFPENGAEVVSRKRR